jgi:hypothetical protein
MEQCLVCGAELRPGVEWCGRCFAPRNTPDPSSPGPATADTGAFANLRVRPPGAAFEVRHSRFRGGPTSMGVVGRALTSVIAVLLAYLIYLYLFSVVLGGGGWNYLALYAVVAVPVLVAVFRKVWRPARIS